ncbi:MAG: DNA repair protein RecO [Alcaligenaceae bacterium]|jgi:DNA repair protein RecO (recombination protein O)|nr:DNA repair protein RecO [Alcaligenaceae bacterium]HZJ98166.1 DNA repair protein RecO [Oligella sp.]
MSKRRTRVLDAEAYLLNAYAWSETSVIAHVFTKDHGLIVGMAKGAKRPYSVMRPILSHFHPLLLSWSGQGEVKTLIRAENNGFCPIQGRALMPAWYMNELLLKFLAPEDPHVELFDIYSHCLEQLASGANENIVLRYFEWQLLEETGYGAEDPMPDFSEPSQTRRWRKQLRQRLDEQLEQRKLKTRDVIQSLHSLARDRG